MGIAYVLIQRHLSPRHLGRGTRTADRHRIADVPRAAVLEKGLDGTRGALWATLGLPGMFVADGLDRPLRDGRVGVSKVASRVVLALCVGVGAGSFFLIVSRIICGTPRAAMDPPLWWVSGVGSTTASLCGGFRKRPRTCCRRSLGGARGTYGSARRGGSTLLAAQSSFSFSS